MRRAQIQIDEEVYELLRKRAFKEKKSIAGVLIPQSLYPINP